MTASFLYVVVHCVLTHLFVSPDSSGFRGKKSEWRSLIKFLDNFLEGAIDTDTATFPRQELSRRTSRLSGHQTAEEGMNPVKEEENGEVKADFDEVRVDKRNSFSSF
jgi:hypothetical protein